jgi:predicted PhzF superfamily epimerase YddE/YHI9
MNLSETAFLYAEGDGFSLRWFTPVAEVDLCGHATLASAHVLWESGRLAAGAPARFRTKSGLLTATRAAGHPSAGAAPEAPASHANAGAAPGAPASHANADAAPGAPTPSASPAWIELDFPATPDEKVSAPPGLADAIGATPRYFGRSRFDYLLELDNEETVKRLEPDFARLSGFPVRGVIATARSSAPGVDFVSRFFAPAVGVNEDPVTGSAHCCLGPYWGRRLKKREFVARQVSARGGVIKVKLEADRVRLAGQAVTVMEGRLTDMASAD